MTKTHAMTQRTDSLDTARLLIEILKRIPRQRRVTAAELQQQLAAHGFERNIRSIQRHLDTLSAEFGLDRDDRSKPFGYRWKEQAAALSLPGLTAQESLLLQLAQQHLQALLPPRLMRSMEPYFEQAGRNLDAGAAGESGDASARSARQWQAESAVSARRAEQLQAFFQHPEVLALRAQLKAQNISGF